MKTMLLLICAFALFSCEAEPQNKPIVVPGGGGTTKPEPEPAPDYDGKTLVILKLDDIVQETGKPVSDYWVRVADFLEGRKVKAAFGIIGYSLEQDNAAYFNWIKDRAQRGYVEFWNHGYFNRTRNDPMGEFEGEYQVQVDALHKTSDLAKEKLGLDLVAWGPHYSQDNEFTDKALSTIPEIIFSFGFPKQPKGLFKGFIMPANVNMEHPVHNPDYDRFLSDYNNYKVGRGVEYFFLQGHPCSWTTDERWNAFVRIVDFLMEQDDVCLVTPGEFLEIMAERAAK